MAQTAAEIAAAKAKLQAEIEAETKAAAEKPRVKTLTVKVSDRIAAYGGEFTDVEQKKTIGAKFVKVTQTAFVQQLLLSDQIVEE